MVRSYLRLLKISLLLSCLSPADVDYEAFVQVVDVPSVSGGRYLEIVMDGEQERAVGYLKR